MTKFFAFVAAGMFALAGTAFATGGEHCDNCEDCTECEVEASGTVVVPLRCDGRRDMNLGDNLRRQQTTVVDGSNGTTTAGFKIIGDDEDWIKIQGSTIKLDFQPEPGHILSSSPGGQNHTLVPDAGSTVYKTGVGPNINTATQVATTAGAPLGLDWHESAGMGSRFVYVGASFTPSNDQQRGLYDGTVTLEVSYY